MSGSVDNILMKRLALLSFFILSSAFAKPCGLSGTVEDRVKECGESKGNFALVAATEKGLEVYKDIKSGLIWGSRILSDFNHYGSQKACATELTENVILSSLKWRLPTIKELEDAYVHGMKEAVPNTSHAYWSSTAVKTRKSRTRRNAPPSQVYIWDGYDLKTDTGDLKEAASVRCVAKEQ